MKPAKKNRRCIAIIGMRAAGKSTLAAALAAELQLRYVDTDERFVARHGPIDAFVERDSWAAFRTREASIIGEALIPDHVVALGGGAIETPAVREWLAQHATVVFLDESRTTIRERLAGKPAGRPSLTGEDVAAEANRIHDARLPLYRAAAQITVPPGLATAAQVAHVVDAWSTRCS